MKRFRHATFTTNLEKMDEVLNDESKGLSFMVNEFDRLKNDLSYLIMSLERGENGNLHIQGYAYRNTQSRFDWWKKHLPTGSHIEPSRGTPEQNRDYVSKGDDTALSEPLEWGDLPAKERQRTDMDEITQMIEDGASNGEVRQAFPGHYLRMKRHIQELREEITYEKYKRITREVRTIYLWGTTGTGKSHMVYDSYDPEDIYVVDNYGAGAFDNYRGEKVIVLDEFRSSFQLSFMLKLLDKYPLKLPARYSDKVACFERVYIISNVPMVEQYPILQEHEPESYKALKRRIHMEVPLLKREDYDFVKLSLDLFRLEDYTIIEQPDRLS